MMITRVSSTKDRLREENWKATSAETRMENDEPNDRKEKLLVEYSAGGRGR